MNKNEYTKHFIVSFDNTFCDKIKINGKTVDGPGILPVNDNQYTHCSKPISNTTKDLIQESRENGKELAEKLIEIVCKNNLKQNVYLSNELRSHDDRVKEYIVTSPKTDINFYFCEIPDISGQTRFRNTIRIQIQTL